MNPRRPSDVPTHYEFTIQGHLDERWSQWFDGLNWN